MMKANLSIALFFLCTLTLFCVHGQEADLAPELLARACESIGGISCAYTYEFRQGEASGDYLRAGSIISQIRRGSKDPFIDEKQIHKALAYYNLTVACTQKTDGFRYSITMDVKRGEDYRGYESKFFNGKTYWVQHHRGPRWDILPYEIYSESIFIYNFLTKIAFSASPVPSEITFSQKNISDLIKETNHTANLTLIKKESGSFRIKIVDPQIIRIDEKKFNDIYEIDFSTKSGIQIQKQCSYRVDAKKALLVDSNKLNATEKLEIYFEKHVPTKFGFSVPTQIRIPLYISRVSTLGELTDSERRTLKSIMPKYEANAVNLLCEHVIKINKIKIGERFSESEFAPSFTKESIVYNHLTQLFENPRKGSDKR